MTRQVDTSRLQDEVQKMFAKFVDVLQGGPDTDSEVGLFKRGEFALTNQGMAV